MTNLISMEVNYQILDSISASIYWKDLKGVYLGCNKYMLKMAGLESREQVVGQTDYQLPWRKQANKIREIDQLVVQNNRTYEVEENPRIYDGTVRSFFSSKTPLTDNDGKITGVIGISIDITEKTKIEEALRRTEESLEKSLAIKERFLKNLSHETRNPLQAFVATAEMLADNWNNLSDAERYDAAQLIASSSRRLSNLVINTFDLSDLMSRNNQLNLTKSNITDLVAKSVESFNASRFPDKKPKIVIAKSEDYYLVFDREKIKQVMDHLLMNSTKWTNSDKIVTVELHKARLPNSSIAGIQCCIKDQGIKIPEEELDFIFEPFAESSNTASKASGVGLGLALCREIMSMHMGAIWAENNRKDGVTFNFIIPTTLHETTE